MKTLKITLLLIAFVMLSPMKTIAQNQRFVIHQDNVKPAMELEFIKTTKELVEACKKYELKDTQWYTTRLSDGSYLFASPIKNMAELDVDSFAPIAEKMGKDNFNGMFEKFNTCYDTHGDFVVVLRNDLSYTAPANATTETQNFTKFHFFYVTPENSVKVANKLKEIKELYTSKKSKESYRIYHSGFGVMNEYYVAVLSAKDEMTYEKTSEENNALLGDEWNKKFNELFVLTTKYDQKTGYAHPELSYLIKK